MFKLTKNGPEGSDCTALYIVQLDKEYTVRGFVKTVLSNDKEWATLGFIMENHFLVILNANTGMENC